MGIYLPNTILCYLTRLDVQIYQSCAREIVEQIVTKIVEQYTKKYILINTYVLLIRMHAHIATFKILQPMISQCRTAMHFDNMFILNAYGAL